MTEIQKKLSEKETRLGVLNEVQGLLRDVGEKEESQGSEKGDVSLDGLDLSGRFQGREVRERGRKLKTCLL